MKLYAFRTYGLEPVRVNDKFIHELEGTKQKTRYRIDGNSQILNYKVTACFGDNVYESFEEAKEVALQRLAARRIGLLEQLEECESSIQELAGEEA